jgi:hypothetical protein
MMEDDVEGWESNSNCLKNFYYFSGSLSVVIEGGLDCRIISVKCLPIMLQQWWSDFRVTVLFALILADDRSEFNQLSPEWKKVFSRSPHPPILPAREADNQGRGVGIGPFRVGWASRPGAKSIKSILLSTPRRRALICLIFQGFLITTNGKRLTRPCGRMTPPPTHPRWCPIFPTYIIS